jgi:hypothetical protein
VSGDPFLELASLAALDVLDGEDRERFSAHEAGCPRCQAEVEAFAHVASRIALATASVPPGALVRARALAKPRVAPLPKAALWALAAAVVLLAGVLGKTWAERNAYHRELVAALARVGAAEQDAQKSEAALVRLRESFSHEAGFRALVSGAEARWVHLAPTGRGPEACIVWNPRSGEAMIAAAGLDPAPQGMAYEVWVIAGTSPVPAGVFHPDPGGRALFKLPAVALSGVKTFAVTVEPAEGTPAPTGPMVLAGNVAT